MLVGGIGYLLRVRGGEGKGGWLAGMGRKKMTKGRRRERRFLSRAVGASELRERGREGL